MPFTLGAKGAEEELAFQRAPAGAPTAASAGDGTLRAGRASSTASSSSRGVQRIDYPHIPIQTLLPPARGQAGALRSQAHAQRASATSPAPATRWPAALRQVGYDVTLLDDEALAHAAARALRRDRHRRARLQHQPAPARFARAADGLRRRRRHAASCSTTPTTASASCRPRSAPTPSRSRRTASPTRTRPSSCSTPEHAIVQRAQPHRRRRLRRLGAGARPLLRRQVGRALSDRSSSMNDPGEPPKQGQPAGRAPRQRRVHLHRPRVLPPAARRRARRLSPVRQPDRVWPMTTTSGRRSSARWNGAVRARARHAGRS